MNDKIDSYKELWCAYLLYIDTIMSYHGDELKAKLNELVEVLKTH